MNQNQPTQSDYGECPVCHGTGWETYYATVYDYGLPQEIQYARRYAVRDLWIFSDEAYREYYGHARAYKLAELQQIPFEQNTFLQQLLEVTKQRLESEYRNIAGSMGFAIRDPATGKIRSAPLMEYYRSTLDNAVMDIHSGAFDYNTVLRRTINQMTASGIRYIEYDS